MKRSWKKSVNNFALALTSYPTIFQLPSLPPYVLYPQPLLYQSIFIISLSLCFDPPFSLTPLFSSICIFLHFLLICLKLFKK